MDECWLCYAGNYISVRRAYSYIDMNILHSYAEHLAVDDFPEQLKIEQIFCSANTSIMFSEGLLCANAALKLQYLIRNSAFLVLKC